MNKYSLIFNVFVFSILQITSCTAQHEKEVELLGTRWRLVKIQSMSDAIGTIEIEDSSVVMNLWKDSSATFQLDCNYGKGSFSYQISSSGYTGSFQFSPIAGTRALCSPPNYGEQFLNAAQYIRGFHYKDSLLSLSLMADGGIYTWKLLGNMMESPENGGPQNWEVVEKVFLKESRSGDSKTIAEYQSGVYLDNLGVQKVGDEIWCYVQKLGGGPVGFVHSSNLKPAISRNGAVFWGLDTSALRMGQGEYDASGTLMGKNVTGKKSKYAFKVTRSGGGYASLKIELSNTKDRVIFFRMRVPIGISSSEADRVKIFKVKRIEEAYSVQIDSIIYQVIDAIILGG